MAAATTKSISACVRTPSSTTTGCAGALGVVGAVLVSGPVASRGGDAGGVGVAGSWPSTLPELVSGTVELCEAGGAADSTPPAAANNGTVLGGVPVSMSEP